MMMMMMMPILNYMCIGQIHMFAIISIILRFNNIRQSEDIIHN